MKISQRITLYGFGFLIGCTMIYFTLIRGKNRSYWLPENRVKELIKKSKMIYSPLAKCEMECRSINEKEIKNILENGDVNFKESNTRGTPHPSYIMEGTTSENKKVRIITNTYDSIAEITGINFLNAEKDSCHCE